MDGTESDESPLSFSDLVDELRDALEDEECECCEGHEHSCDKEEDDDDGDDENDGDYDEVDGDIASAACDLKRAQEILQRHYRGDGDEAEDQKALSILGQHVVYETNKDEIVYDHSVEKLKNRLVLKMKRCWRKRHRPWRKLKNSLRVITYHFFTFYFKGPLLSRSMWLRLKQRFKLQQSTRNELLTVSFVSMSICFITKCI